ncbi:MAG TPA: glycerol-3-phosphate 1-O-acyltransferase PlsY, partial [Gemmataceae bacterium]
MNPTPTAVLLVAAAYLLGSIPFGVLVARSRGVDLFRAGSGNIGATNVGRVLGRRWGLLVFLLDLGKGVLGVAMVDAIAPRVPGALTAFGPPDMLRVAAALAVFLGHLFPVYLGFRGGKGVATGAGTVLVLLPGPALVAVLVWLAVVSSTRLVSLGSLAAALALVAGRLLTVARPFSGDSVILTVFTLAGTALVYFKHRSNILRLISGTENRVRDTDMWRTLSKALHVLALGTWLGSAVFFNFLAAPTIFATFREVVETAPNDRTAGLPLLTTE